MIEGLANPFDDNQKLSKDFREDIKRQILELVEQPGELILNKGSYE